MWGIVPVEDKKIKTAFKDVTVLSNTSHILRGMATCHSLNLINNEVCGDPLDVKVCDFSIKILRKLNNLFFQMFESIGWLLEDIYEANRGNNAVHHHLVVKPRHTSCTEVRQR